MNETHNTVDSIRLFCLPFAGGSYYSYFPLEKHINSRICLTPIDLPGHGRRMREPLLSDLDDMCEDVYDQISHQLNSPYAILGHSMGALLGYLVTQKIEARGAPRPVHLFVSGRQGPSVPGRHKNVHLLPKEDFIKHLQHYGGIQDEILKEKDLMDLFEPIMRADFKALNYAHINKTPLTSPITVFLGTADTITYEEAMTWQAVTHTPITLHQFPGGHFFIFNNLADIGRIVSETILAALVQFNKQAF